MVESAGDLPVLLQEAGYPAGYLPAPANDSSGEKQRQFVANMFDAIQAHSEIRFVSFVTLVDFSPEICNTLYGYYGVAQPVFKEYLCTLGMVGYDGQTKPAYVEFIARLTEFHKSASR
jgi:hypothetical protein